MALSNFKNYLSSRDFLFKRNPKTIFSLPSFSKIVLHTGLRTQAVGAKSLEPIGIHGRSMIPSLGSAENERKKILAPLLALEMISGQKPKKTRAKKFIAGFKLKKDQLLGYQVTLRKKEMISFLEKFVHIVLPKVRDLRSFSDPNFFVDQNQKRNSKKPEHDGRQSRKYQNLMKLAHGPTDNHGNLNLGFSNFFFFPEIENNYEIFENVSGFQISFCTKQAYLKDEKILLFSSFQLPF